VTLYVRLQKLWISASVPPEFKASFPVTLIKRFESLVLGCEAAFACNVQNQEDFPDKLREGLLRSIDALYGKGVQVLHL